MKLSFFIAKRLLLNKHSPFSRVFVKIAIVATTLSVASMLLADAFVGGFQLRLRQKLFGFMGHVHVMPYTASTANLLHSISMDGRGLPEIFKDYPPIKSFAPFVMRTGILRSDEEMEGIKLKGVNAFYCMPAIAQLKGSSIDYSDISYAKQIVISTKTASRLKLKLNDAVFLYFIEEGSIFPRIRKLQVVGLYETGMEEIDKSMAVCDIRLLQRMNGWAPHEVSGFQLQLEEGEGSEEIAAHLNQQLGTDVQAVALSQIFPNIFSWLQMLNNNVFIIFIVMTIVAVVNIITALLLFAIDRISMSGILKAMGLREVQLQMIHLWHALLIAFLGLLLGNVLALVICLTQIYFPFIKLDKEVYGMAYAAVRLKGINFLYINLLILAVCFLSLWLPAYFLRKINVMKAIKFK